MINKFLLVLVALLSTLNLSCFKQGKSVLKGKVFYSSYSGFINELDLSTLEEKTIYQKPSETIRQLKVIPGPKIIFSAARSLSEDTLKEFNLTTNEVQNLCVGYSPTYMAEHNVLFFYVNKETDTSDYSTFLFVVKLNEIKKPTMICYLGYNNDENLFDSGCPVVQISRDKIVFRGGPNGTINEYDYVTGQISETELKNYYPLAWREPTGELFCSDLEIKHFYLINWFTKSLKEIYLGENTSGWTYIKEYDVLLFSKEFFVGYNLYLYNFKDSKIERVKVGVSLNKNSGYLPPGN